MRKHTILSCLVAIVCLLVSLSNAHADEKLPVPPQAAQDEAMELVKEVFGNELTSRDTEVQKRVATALFKEAENPDNPPAMRYALLMSSARIAASAGDIESAMAAIEKVESLFRARTGEVRLSILRLAEQAGRSPEDFASIATNYFQLAYIAIQNDEFDVADQAAKLAVTTARRGRNQELARQATALINTIQEQARIYQQVERALHVLETEPDHPRANEAVGKYICFMKGDWNAGLPYLAKSEDKALAGVAHTDLDSPSSSDAQNALADAWYGLAEKEANERVKANLLARAGVYYEKAAPGLSGIMQTRVRRRIEGIQQTTEVVKVQTPDGAPLSTITASQEAEQIPVKIYISCDGSFKVHINGRQVWSGAGRGQSSPDLQILEGDIVAIYAESDSDRPGLAAWLVYKKDLNAYAITPTFIMMPATIEDASTIRAAKGTLARPGFSRVAFNGYFKSVQAIQQVSSSAVWHGDSKGWLVYKVKLEDGILVKE